MTIKEAKAVLSIFGDVSEIILATAYTKDGEPLIKKVKLLLNQADKKRNKFPKYFKTKTT